MLVAAMHDKAWLAVGVNDKKLPELFVFIAKVGKSVAHF